MPFSDVAVHDCDLLVNPLDFVRDPTEPKPFCSEKQCDDEYNCTGAFKNDIELALIFGSSLLHLRGCFVLNDLQR